MFRRHPVVTVVAAISLVGVCVFFLNFHAVQVSYHRWRMQHAWNQIFSKPTTSLGNGIVGYGNAEVIDQYEYHREQLVALGAVVERKYTFQHLHVPSPEAKHLLRVLLNGTHPPLIDFNANAPRTPEPLKLTVWCDLAEAQAWDFFVAQHDVPDYGSRLMSEVGSASSPRAPSAGEPSRTVVETTGAG